jgi:hypothetical protein
MPTPLEEGRMPTLLEEDLCLLLTEGFVEHDAD